mgnify:CR=1 FL=1
MNKTSNMIVAFGLISIQQVLLAMLANSREDTPLGLVAFLTSMTFGLLCLMIGISGKNQ